MPSNKAMLNIVKHVKAMIPVGMLHSIVILTFTENVYKIQKQNSGKDTQAQAGCLDSTKISNILCGTK